ncbi:MAG: PEGA domain-containing protein [Deltaproteobacteria bacterium]|nr:PEGA domain-containing protein [Deltaproteobacteria bacterium]
MSRTLVLVAALLVTARIGSAQPAPPRIVALLPLSTLGTEDTSVSTRKLTTQLEVALSSLPGTKVLTAAHVADAIKKARKGQLKICERDAACLAEVGKLVGATIVIDGEVGGLGDSKIVYLAATDVATVKELRSTTLSVGAKEDSGGGPMGAAVRLLEPDRYRGVLRFVIDAKGATVYVNGTKAALGGKNEIALPVGTQAVRVTHPEYRDFVRFIDVPYNRTTEVAVGMAAYPIIKHDLQGKPINSDTIQYIEPPWYRRPVVVAGGAIIVTVASAVIVALLVNDPLGGRCRKVGGGSCD